MKENKKFKSFRSELTESEYSEVIMGQPNTSAHTDFGTHRIDYPKVMANINAMLSVISKTSSVDPMEAFNKIRCRLNIVMLDFDFNIFRNWDQGVGSFVVPVTRFGRVDGYDAMTGQVRFDGKANNPDGFKELSMVVTVDLDADSLYVVSAKLYTADELQTTDAVDSVEEETAPSRGATRKELDAEKIMDYQAAQKFYEKDMPNQIMRARLEDRKRTAAKNSVKEDIQTPARVTQSRNIVGDAVDRANDSKTDRQEKIRVRKLNKVANRHNMETRSRNTYGMGGKIVKKATMKEDVEQVDELSKGLLKRYKAAATVNADNLEKEGDRHSRNVQHGNLTPKQKKLSMKIRSRMYGKSDERRFKIGQAERKLKEDVEQVDEAGQAKLYRMRYSHGRAWRRGDKKKQDTMGVATYDKQKKEDAKDLNRTGSAFGMRVKRLAGNRKAMGYSESALIGKQKKLDANNNKRLDSQDFKLLRSKKSVKEELIGKQKKLDVNKNKRLDAEDFKALRAKRIHEMMGEKKKPPTWDSYSPTPRSGGKMSPAVEAAKKREAERKKLSSTMIIKNKR